MPSATEIRLDESGVRGLYADLLDAWNRRDASGMAGLFAPDGVLVGFDGSNLRGAEVEAHLAPIFTDHATARFVASVRAVRPLGPGTALLHALVGMVPPGQDALDPDVNAVQALVGEDTADGWRVVLFQNTPARYSGRPDLAARHTAEVSAALADRP